MTDEDSARRNRLRQASEAVAAEQQRIGTELHDGLGQQLTGLSMLAGSLARKLEAAGSQDAEAARTLGQGIQHAIREIRRIVYGLVPIREGQIESDLRRAFTLLCENTDSSSAIGCHLHLDLAEAQIGHGAANQLYRIAQEAVQNALKHSQAREIRVSLAAAGDRLELQVRDDGRGMDREMVDQTAGRGLQIMRHRAEMIGAQLQIRSSSHSGTVVRCTVMHCTGSTGEPHASDPGRGEDAPF